MVRLAFRHGPDAHRELPVGLVIAFVGAPVLIWWVRRAKVGIPTHLPPGVVTVAVGGVYFLWLPVGQGRNQ